MARSMFRISLALFFAALLALRADAQQLVQGTTPTGALYAFAVPDDWNGDLIIYGHGIVDPAAPMALPTTQDGFTVLKEALLERGFAVAYSSYSENGYALKDAFHRLHELPALFEARVNRRPRARLPDGPLARRRCRPDAGRAVSGQVRRRAGDVRLRQRGRTGGSVPWRRSGAVRRVLPRRAAGRRAHGSNSASAVSAG